MILNNANGGLFTKNIGLVKYILASKVTCTQFSFYEIHCVFYISFIFLNLIIKIDYHTAIVPGFMKFNLG